jgi:cobalt/nickel transport system permease protein
VISLLPMGSFLAMAITWLVLVACSATAGLGPFRLSRSAVIALPFAIAAFPLIFTAQAEIITTIRLGPLDLTVSAEGIRRFLTILAGSWLSVQVALLLAFTGIDGRSGGSLRWRATVTGRMVGSLFLRAYERSERIYAAMQARGFEGEFRHLRARALRRTELAWLFLLLALFALYEVIAFLWLPRQ